MDRDGTGYEFANRAMSGILPSDLAVFRTSEIGIVRCLEYCQVTWQCFESQKLSPLEYCQVTWWCSRHRDMRSGIEPGQPGSVTDLRNTNCAMSGILPSDLAVLLISKVGSWHNQNPIC